MGFYISFTGAITFKNAAKFPGIIKSLPLERLLVETDCPYLTPVPHRGELNYPKYVKYQAMYIAEHGRNNRNNDGKRIQAVFQNEACIVMKKKDNVYAYLYGGNIYVNLTNRCCNNCTFCLRNTGDGVSGSVLWLEKEPTP